MIFFYYWCTQKPNIKSDDLIYTNDYHIKYNGPNEWLNTNNDNNEIKDLNKDKNNDNKYENKENSSTKKISNSHDNK